MTLVSPRDRPYAHRIEGRVHLGSSPASGRLVGRSRECRALEELIDSVRRGRSGVLVLRGEAGVGKSALLQHLLDAADGFQITHASAVESEMELPFAGLQQLVAPLASFVQTLPGPQRDAVQVALGEAAGDPPDRLLLGLAALNLMAAASEERPLVCAVDDAHWLDRASSQALAFVARRLLAEPVALVFATRTQGVDFTGVPELEVNGLRDGDAHTLLSEVVRIPLDARVRDRLVAETRGNPLALREWSRGASPAALAGGFGQSAHLQMATQIERIYRSRIAELPARTQQFLTVAAAEPMGDAMVVWRAAGALGLGADAAAPAIDTGLIEIGLRVQFCHPLARSAVYNLAGSSDRSLAHRALGEMTDEVVDPDRRAWHRALGSDGPDEGIAEELVRSAGRARSRGGLAAAAALLSRSIALSDDPAKRGQRILAAAVASLEAASFDEAFDLIRLADSAPLVELDRARLDLVRARCVTVHLDLRDGPAHYLRVAQRLESLDPELARSAHLQAMTAVATSGRFSRSTSAPEIARSALDAPRSAELSTNEWLLTGLAQLTLDGPTSAAAALRRGMEPATVETIAAERFHLLGYQCAAASALMDCTGLHELSARQVRVAREVGALTMLPSALNTLASTHVLEGDLRSAAMHLREASEIHDAVGGQLLSWGPCSLEAWRGSDDAPALIEETVARAQEIGHGLALVKALWAAATLHNARGEYAEAHAVGIEARYNTWNWGEHHHLHELVEAAARCGDIGLASTTTDRLEEYAEASESDWGRGIVARCRALVAGGAEAESLYDDALGRLSSTPLRPELARTHLLCGEWLRREKRRVDARGHLRAAHDLFESMEMRGFAERARRELLATGETVRSRSSTSFDQLTPQEAHIAELAVEGHTNSEIGARLFISSRTVEWHLRKVFAKLGISSRRELRSALPRTTGARLD